MDINGKMQEAELLDSGKARQPVRGDRPQDQGPALLEYVGRDAFKVRIFPIEPNSRKQIKITYTQLLKSDSGLTEYVYPLNTEKFSSRAAAGRLGEGEPPLQGAAQERLQPEPQRRDPAGRRARGDGRLGGAERPPGHRLQGPLLPHREAVEHGPADL